MVQSALAGMEGIVAHKIHRDAISLAAIEDLARMYARGVILSAMLEKAGKERNLERLEAVSRSLAGLRLPPLTRPDIAEGQPATRGLVDWAIRFYGFGILSHYREMLRSFLELAQHGNIAAAFVVARCLFEMGAHAYYVHKHVTQYLKADDLSSAWKFLNEINMGSRYMREEIVSRAQGSEEPDFPAPREIAKVMKAFNEWGNIGQALTNYSFLSEFSHPNMAAFSHYYRMEMDKQQAARTIFIDPPRAPVDAPLSIVCVSVTASLFFTLNLLRLTGETEVTAVIIQGLDEIAAGSSSAEEA